MGYTPVSQRNSAGANIPAKPVSVGGYTPVSSRSKKADPFPISTAISSVLEPPKIEGEVNGYLPVSKRPEGFTPVKPIAPAVTIEEPKNKRNLFQKYNDWAQNFGNKNASKPLTEVIAPIGVGAMRTVGSTIGALETVRERIIPDNPISRLIDKVISPEKRKVGDKIEKYADKADSAISELTDNKDKTYLRMVSEGLGSSIPFIAGGMAANAAKLPATLASAGFAGVESMINGYDDYKALLEKGDDEKTASKKALASFGANLALNYATNKLGGFFDTLKPGVIPSLKRFLTITLSETGQETAQTVISNLTTGRKAGEGVAETALISLPISGLFGLGGITIPNKKVKDEFEKMVTKARDEGVTDEQLTKAISGVYQATEENVKKAIQGVPANTSTGATNIGGYIPVKMRKEDTGLGNRVITVEKGALEGVPITDSFGNPVNRTGDKPVGKGDKLNVLEAIGTNNKVRISADPEENGTIHINKFESIEPGQGNFKESIKDVLEYADKNNVRITVTPGDDFGSDSVRLEKTFREIGFIDNPNADNQPGKLVYIPTIGTRTVTVEKGALKDIPITTSTGEPVKRGPAEIKKEKERINKIELKPSQAKTKEEDLKEKKSVGINENPGNTKTIPKPLIGKTQLKSLLQNSEEFKAKPELVVDAEKNLVFEGKKQTFKIKASALGLNEEKLKKGDKITVDPKDLKAVGAGQQMRAYKGGKVFASIGNFRDGTPVTLAQKESVNIIELPEMVDLARDLMGQVPKIRQKASRAFGGQALGVFVSKDGGEIRLRADLFDPKVTSLDQAAKTLAHEIGHLIDYLPDRNLIRGNLLGRLSTLREFRKDFFAEAGASRTNKQVTKELWELSQYWKPIDLETSPASFIEYRKSAKEIYADFISVLFNDPKLAQEMAPEAYNAFFEQLDKKPQVFNAYFELQEILGGDRDTLLARRREGVRGMFDRGDMLAGDIQRARMAIIEERRKNVAFNFRFNVIDKNYALIDRVKKLQKEGTAISDDENPIYYLEERNYLGGKIKSFMEKNVQPIYKKLQDNDISWTDFGEALFYDRIRAGDRSDVANPRGITPQASEELLEKMMKEMGEEKATILVESMDKFRKAMQTVAEDAFTEGLYKEEMHEQMMKNPAYATFQVLDHLEEGMTSKIHKSLGTLKDISNPADASLLKTIATIRAIERNKVTKKVVEFLEKNFKEDIEPAKTIKTPKGTIPKESNLPFQEMITYMKDGKRVGFYVDKYIKASVENETIGQTIAVLRALNSALFRPLFITYNPGFQAFNFARDFQRFWKNTPNMTIPKALRLYRQAIPAAKARAWGDTTNEILQKMEEEQILSISYNQLTDGADVENKQIDTILKNSGIETFEPRVRYKALQPFVKFLDYIKSMGDFIETLPKVAGYLEFTEGGTKEITKEQKSFIRKNIGSPDFLAGGFWKPVTNEVFLFSNSITQGIRSDVNMATDPKTRSGYWFKTAKINLLPKLMMLLASLGFFGKEIKEIMEGASEYDKTNYTIVPLGVDENGKSIYFRMPQDEGGRLISSLAWKFLNTPANKQSAGKDFVDIISLTGGQIPSVTPAISNVVATGQFITGQNPYDWFRNREVLTDDQMKAGGKYAAKPFLGWLFNQAGGGIFYRFNQGAPKEKSATEKLFNLPVLGNVIGRFIKVTDYGKTEELNKIKEGVQKEQSRRRLDENEVITSYIKDSQKNLDDKSIEELVEKNKADIVNEVLGHAPETKEELTRANNIIKKYQIGLKRGESDPLINSLISAVTNEEKIELLTEMRKTLTIQEYNALMLESLKYKIVSPEVFIKIPNPAKNQ